MVWYYDMDNLNCIATAKEDHVHGLVLIPMIGGDIHVDGQAVDDGVDDDLNGVI